MWRKGARAGEQGLGAEGQEEDLTATVQVCLDYIGGGGGGQQKELDFLVLAQMQCQFI